MGLFDKLKQEFIDIIEWQDPSTDTIVWRFPRYQNEIKMGAKLTVRESQVAVFLNEGKIADVYQPGMYTLETQNMPLLSTLRGWKYGFNSPFKADVYFVNTKQFIDQKWGTKNPITLSDDRFGMIELRAFGSFAFKVTDAGTFLKEVSGTEGEYTTDEVTGQLKSLIVTKFTDAVGKGNLPIEKFAGNLEDISKMGIEKLNAEFVDYGITMTKFIVENISMPEELKKEIFEYSRLNKVDLNKLAQMKAAKSIEVVAANQGTTGMGMGLGMGVGMGNMMGNMMGNAMMGNQQQQQQQQQQAPVNMPPPMPQAVQYFVAVNGQQAGPFNEQQLLQMAQSGQLTRESLIWKNGMAGWLQAGQVNEVSNVFGSVPPPMPPGL
jgi:membrane protease subunit (stomatin/prohibitin family)